MVLMLDMVFQLAGRDNAGTTKRVVDAAVTKRVVEMPLMGTCTNGANGTNGPSKKGKEVASMWMPHDKESKLIS